PSSKNSTRQEEVSNIGSCANDAPSAGDIVGKTIPVGNEKRRKRGGAFGERRGECICAYIRGKAVVTPTLPAPKTGRVREQPKLRREVRDGPVWPCERQLKMIRGAGQHVIAPVLDRPLQLFERFLA